MWETFCPRRVNDRAMAFTPCPSPASLRIKSSSNGVFGRPKGVSKLSPLETGESLGRLAVNGGVIMSHRGGRAAGAAAV